MPTTHEMAILESAQDRSPQGIAAKEANSLALACCVVQGWLEPADRRGDHYLTEAGRKVVESAHGN